ncbi:hypothetical protein AB0H37_34915 [Actinomadura sp. NPDC023710]|uniref:hypothetical protein n=1 Tax=Actinomadura sp. NPDC023710 TaxID=3158219 RepID=UPI0033C4377A
MTDPLEHDPLAFAETTTPAYAAAFLAEDFAYEIVDDGVVLRGRCPRCRATVEANAFENVVVRKGAEGGSFVQGPHPIPVYCTCLLDHPGRPEGIEGCGAYWRITMNGQPT